MRERELKRAKRELREGPVRMKRESRESLKGDQRELGEGPKRVRRGSLSRE